MITQIKEIETNYKTQFLNINPMLKNEIKKKSIKKITNMSQPELTCQIHTLSHETRITL